MNDSILKLQNMFPSTDRCLKQIYKYYFHIHSLKKINKYYIWKILAISCKKTECGRLPSVTSRKLILTLNEFQTYLNKLEDV